MQKQRLAAGSNEVTWLEGKRKALSTTREVHRGTTPPSVLMQGNVAHSKQRISQVQYDSINFEKENSRDDFGLSTSEKRDNTRMALRDLLLGAEMRHLDKKNDENRRKRERQP